MTGFHLDLIKRRYKLNKYIYIRSQRRIFHRSVLIGISSEWQLSPRIHNTDQQCYEFWVRVVIPSSFRWARNDEISSFEVPNLVYTYLPNSTFTKKSIEAQLGIYCNDTYLHINGTIYINIWALWYMFCRLKTDTKRTSALASCLD